MSKKMWPSWVLLGVMWLPSVLMASPQNSSTRTLYVANNALDSATCGSSNKPCRSISRAIANARNGDRILVRPGRYGDLNSDGDFNDPGEEAAEIGFGCRCMILVDKRLKLESEDGATVTVLDAAGAQLNVVSITANGVVLGGNGKGFTLTGSRRTGDDDGIGVEILADRDVRVIGNIASDNRDAGFLFFGSRHTAKNNIATGNGQGFVFAFTEEGNTVHGNVATSNGTEEVFGHGFTIFGNGYSVVSNRAIGNDGNGFLISATSGEGSVFKDNDAIGNRDAGIRVLRGAGPEFHKNNLFGNLGEGRPPVLEAAPNCGLINESGSTVDATFNFWGAPTGPGPDPADDAGPGSICDLDGVTLVKPFETRPSRLELEPLMLDADAPAAQDENPEGGDDNG